ncbi:MAG TPA: hypothetical protein VMU89_14040 [Thermomicrobiaceae bacterium]|nr:hypothetical protein [Thermomicrobiaceae bacterium]
MVDGDQAFTDVRRVADYVRIKARQLEEVAPEKLPQFLEAIGSVIEGRPLDRVVNDRPPWPGPVGDWWERTKAVDESRRRRLELLAAAVKANAEVSFDLRTTVSGLDEDHLEQATSLLADAGDELDKVIAALAASEEPPNPEPDIPLEVLALSPRAAGRIRRVWIGGDGVKTTGADGKVEWESVPYRVITIDTVGKLLSVPESAFGQRNLGPKTRLEICTALAAFMASWDGPVG